MPTSADAVAVAAAAAATSNTSLVDRSPTTSPLRAFNFPADFEPYVATTPPRTSNGVSQPMGNNHAAAAATAGIAGTTRSRLRSSSMLSAVSNFTDDFDPPAPGLGSGAGAGANVIGSSRPKSSVVGETPLVLPTTTSTAMSRNDSAVVAAKEQLKSGWGSVKMSRAMAKPVGEPLGYNSDKGIGTAVSDDPSRDDASAAGNGGGHHVNASFRNSSSSLANKSW